MPLARPARGSNRTVPACVTCEPSTECQAMRSPGRSTVISESHSICRAARAPQHPVRVPIVDRRDRLQHGAELRQVRDVAPVARSTPAASDSRSTVCSISLFAVPGAPRETPRAAARFHADLAATSSAVIAATASMAPAGAPAHRIRRPEPGAEHREIHCIARDSGPEPRCRFLLCQQTCASSPVRAYR